jgi:murein biosynthesis integral membrane protein MurJ
VSGGSSGDVPRRGGVRGGHGRDSRYQPPGPGGRNEPDEDGTAARPGSGDLSDLWREPDPWAADARRGLEAWQDGDQPGHGDQPPYSDQQGNRDQPRYSDWPGYGDQPGYPDGRGQAGRAGYGPGPGHGGREDAGGTARGHRDDDPWHGGPAPDETYQGPVTWSGRDRGRGQARREPDAPTEVRRNPSGWYDPPERPRDQVLGARTGSQPRPPAGQDAWRQAPPPAGPPRRPAAAAPGPTGPGDGEPGPTGPGQGEPDYGERAWWDDAFRPSATSDPGRAGSAGTGRAEPGRGGSAGERRAEPGRPQPGHALPPGQPPRPPRPAPPRRPSAQGYGVPPGELTQPIPIFQPQGTFVADAYRAADADDEDALAETAYVPQPAVRRDRAAPGGTGLARSIGSMAMGTLISRVTGFLRLFVFVYALGTVTLANAYNNANTLPNAVYDVMIGGVLTSVVVPLLVKAAKEHRDGGEAYDQRMFTLTVAALGVVTVVATVAAGLLVELYASSVHGAEHRLMVVFAYFFIPQIFFYGLSSLIGAILNARNSFAAPMWTPIINNVVVIVVGLLFVVIDGQNSASTVSGGGVLLLGVGTTLGIIVQTIALFPALRKVGFRWQPRFDFRRAELAEIGRMAVWMLGYVVSTQITFIVTTNLANAASVHVPDAGVSAYNYAYTLFLLPYAIIGVSVTTALLPRMSKHAAEGRFWLVRDDFSASIRLSSVVLVPAALLLAVLGPALCEVLFSYHSSTVEDARYIGEVFGAFSLGLVPFVIFQLLLRVFYALHDSRTPAIIGFLTMIAAVIGNLIVAAILPHGEVVVGMAFVYGVSYVFSAVIAWRLLNRRVGSLDGRVITRSLVRMHVATIPPLILAVAVSAAVGTVAHDPGRVYGFLTVLIGGGGALLLYVIVARALRLDELSQLMGMVGGRFGRRAQGRAGR